MKKLLALAFAGLAIVGFEATARAGAQVNGTVIERTQQSVNTTIDFDVSDMDRFSMQAVYSDGTPSSHTFIDGAKSTGRLTVASGSTGNALIGASIRINGVTLTQGVHWSTGSSVTLIALSISSAIVNSASLTNVVTSTYVAGVIYATAAVVGSNQYSVGSSTIGLSWQLPYFTGGKESDIDLTANTIAKTSHGLTTGTQVLFSTAGANTVTGLTNQTTYYAIRLNENSYQLATTSTTAVAGTAIDLTAVAGSSTFGIVPAPLSLLANNGFYWQASNDGTNFATLSVSSVTYAAAGNTIWDFAANNYKKLRVNFTAPTRGAINLAIKMNGRKYN